MAHSDSLTVGDIHRFSQLLADAAASTELTTPIPTCEGWTMADLVWHMTEVQNFWTFIISNRPAGPEHYERPQRTPDSHLVTNFRSATAGLLAVLENAPASDTAWSWAEEQTVGFTRRRQVHEALTHCVDALMAVGQGLPEVSPELAADGIDEIVHVMLTGLDESPGRVALHATDTDDRWTVAAGSGTCQISGRALALNLWLWGRADIHALSITGDVAQAETLREIMKAKT